MKKSLLFTIFSFLTCLWGSAQTVKHSMQNPARPTLLDQMPRLPAATSAPTGGRSVARIAEHEDYSQMMRRFRWDSMLSEWDSSARYTYTYNANGQVTEEIEEAWNGSAYIQQSKTTNTYNTQMLLDSSFTYSWTGTAWVPSTKEELQYDNFGNLTQYLRYGWTGGGWDTTYGDRTTYTYVFTHRIASSIEEIYNSSLSSWIPFSKNEYHYPSAEGWDRKEEFMYDTVSAAWVPSERVTDATWHDFDQELPLTGQLQSYDSATGMWYEEFRLSVTYSQYDSYDALYSVMIDSTLYTLWREIETNDARGHLILSAQMSWDGVEWIQDWGDRYTYTYDAQGHTTEIIQETWNPARNAYEFSQKEVFTNFFTRAEAPHGLSHTVTSYPNPCIQELNFSFGEMQTGRAHVALYDMKGTKRMEMSSQVTAQVLTLPISGHLEAGVYTYRLTTRQGQATGKVVVQR